MTDVVRDVSVVEEASGKPMSLRPSARLIYGPSNSCSVTADEVPPHSSHTRAGHSSD